MSIPPANGLPAGVPPPTVPAEGTVRLTAWLAAHAARSAPSGTGSSTDETARRRLQELAVSDDSRYELGSLVARGGMGEVLASRDLVLRREVAMKVMLDPESASSEQLLRFIEEAQITGQLQHPNIVPVHELGLDPQGRVYYTMKLVQGQTLKAIVQALAEGDPATVSAFPLPRLLRLFQQVCDAVAFAHSRGILHRDLKPANIMVGEYGEVLVMDWGLAKHMPRRERSSLPPAEPPPASAADLPARDDGHWALAPAPRGEADELVLTMDGAVMGTPCYMAPEQALGRNHEIGEVSDVYALGAILYELLTLKKPVTADSGYELLVKTVRGELVPPAHHATRQRPVPAALSAVAMTALATAPADRYPTVQALRAEIETYLNGFATRAERASLPRRAWLLLNRHRGVAALGTAAVLVLAVLSLGYAYHAHRQQQALQQVSSLAAPEFVAKARQAALAGDLVQAEANLAIALGLDRQNAVAMREQGELHLRRFRFAAAAATLAQADRLVGGRGSEASALTGLARQWQQRHPDGEAKLSSDELRVLAEELVAIGEHTLAAWFLGQLVGDTAALMARCEAAWQQLQADNPGLQPNDRPYRYHGERDLVWEAYQDANLVDLTALRGLPLKNLYLTKTGVKDLSPLTGMPLQTLVLDHTPVADLTPLRGLPLRQLALTRTQVTDLSPLAGAPLEILSLDSTAVQSLEPLRGMPLKRLFVSRTAVTDLSPLAGMALERLTMVGCQVTDLGPLAGMPMKLLTMSITPVTDLSPLAGMPLEEISALSTGISDLSPLKDSPLRRLTINSTLVADLTPLAGLPLESLDIRWTRVTDLEPLRGLPLKLLYCEGLQLRSAAPLATLPQIEDLTIPLATPDLPKLRALTSLKSLRPSSREGKSMKPELFWLEYERWLTKQQAAPPPSMGRLLLDLAERAVRQGTPLPAAGTPEEGEAPPEVQP